LAKRIIDLMPRHLHYVEPYAGGLAVLLAKDPDDSRHQWGTASGEKGVSEVVNDTHTELTGFWRVLQNDRLFKMFERVVGAIPFSEVEWDEASIVSPSPVDGAVRFFVRCRQSRAGKMNDFAPLSRNRTRRSMNEQASAWMTAVEGLPAVAARLKRVVILKDDAIRVIEAQDGAKTLFYCDPTYLHETRATNDDYAHEMSAEDHRELLETLAGIEGKFLLSGYRSTLYDDFAKANGWRREDFDLPNNAAAGKKKRRMIECVWMNYQKTAGAEPA
jgi:DNA adenine methylase